MSLEKEKKALAIIDRLRERGFVAYLAGGCVRDRALGVAAKDYDIATDARPEVVQEFRICIDPVLPNIDLKVPKQMSENIQNENQRGNGHDKLFANGGLVKGNQRVIGELPDRNG